MSITNDGNQTMICCDGCGTESHTVDRGDFQSLVDDLKADKWIIRNNGGWTHHCPECEDESPLARAKRKFGIS